MTSRAIKVAPAVFWRLPFSKLPTLAALRRRVLRAVRIVKARCTECGARLFPGDGRLCSECRRGSRLAAASWRAANPAIARQQLVNYRAKNRERVNAYERTYYEERKLAGICVKCTDRALDDSLFCEKHREMERAKARRYQARRRARLAGGTSEGTGQLSEMKRRVFSETSDSADTVDT